MTIKQRKVSLRKRKINTTDQDQGQLQDQHQGHHQGHYPDLIKEGPKQKVINQESTNIKIVCHQGQGHHQGQIPDRLIKRIPRPDVLNQKVHKHKSQSLSCSVSQSRSQSRSHRTKTRSKKTERRSHRHSPHSDSDTDSSVDRCSKHGNPRKHPKALCFDGKTIWLSFKKKFDSYRKVMKWSEEESKDYLMWSLEGKALDFLTITKIDLEKYSFRKIMKKLETRFGVKELTETSKAKFRQAFQKHDESLQVWADRVITLATPAFVDLPEDHLKKEAIARFCQGCTDKEAAKHACLEQPETMEEALNLVKHHQYISQAVDGKKAKREYEASVNA